MEALLKIKGNEEEVVIITKGEYDALVKENEKLKSQLGLSYGLQKGLISGLEGKFTTPEDIRLKRAELSYE
ncbi:hypothetical protein [Lactococcus termiticola]|uniref:Uncharacterized protein n=1 Tax=Lactococcus termiticola TaxID=2169526 RepID=A0A2R5HH89_9LACT|nr:hypothetical protein [Lactococcus termiticola]GBG97374.1 hypothetical protein NtB2_01514 [Lactococcus termiticola]